MYLLLKMVVFHCYVSLPECNQPLEIVLYVGFCFIFPSFKTQLSKVFPQFFQQSNASIHSLKLTWHLKIGQGPKRKLVFQPSIFRCENVSFRECNPHFSSPSGWFSTKKKNPQFSKDAMDSLNKTPQPSWNPSITFDLWKLKNKTPTWKGSNRCFTQPQLPWWATFHGKSWLVNRPGSLLMAYEIIPNIMPI